MQRVFKISFVIFPNLDLRSTLHADMTIYGVWTLYADYAHGYT